MFRPHDQDALRRVGEANPIG